MITFDLSWLPAALACLAAAVSWGITQADMRQVKKEIGAVRRLERRVERLSTLIEVRFGIKAGNDIEEEDTRL